MCTCVRRLFTKWYSTRFKSFIQKNSDRLDVTGEIFRETIALNEEIVAEYIPVFRNEFQEYVFHPYMLHIKSYIIFILILNSRSVMSVAVHPMYSCWLSILWTDF